MDRARREPILVIGDYTNRDYDTLSKSFKEVYSLDVIKNPHVPAPYYIQQSVEHPLPFPDGFFNTVIMGEVIENVWRDKDTLLELRRVLADDGTFMMSLEFYADEAQHYHIYSPKTLELLLTHSGFRAVETRYSGLAPAMFKTKLVALLALLTYPVFGGSSLKKITHFAWHVDWAFSRFQFPNSLFNMTAYVNSRKAPPVDSLRVQVEYYQSPSP